MKNLLARSVGLLTTVAATMAVMAGSAAALIYLICRYVFRLP